MYELTKEDMAVGFLSFPSRTQLPRGSGNTPREQKEARNFGLGYCDQELYVELPKVDEEEVIPRAGWKHWEAPPNQQVIFPGPR